MGIKVVFPPPPRLLTSDQLLEFTADEGTCNMPYWMMQQLGFKEGSLAIVRQQNMLPGTFAKIQPHSKDFLDISNPRAVLEKHLRDYSCMTRGDVFQVGMRAHCVFPVCSLLPPSP